MILSEKYDKLHNYFLSFFKISIYFIWEVIYQTLLFRKSQNRPHSFYPIWKRDEGKSKCTGCNICSKVCPVNAIQIKMRKNSVEKFEIKLDACYGCDICVDVCPYDLLVLKEIDIDSDMIKLEI